MDNSMPFFFIGLLASVPLWFLCRQADRECPNCRSMIPLFVAPWDKTRRQWVKGGFFCQRCQIEVNLQGNRVSEDEPPIGTAAFLRVMVPMLLTPVLAVVVGYFVFFWGKDLIKRDRNRLELRKFRPLQELTISKKRVPFRGESGTGSLLKEHEKAGDVTFHHIETETAFWKYAQREHVADTYPRGDRLKKLLASPPYTWAYQSPDAAAYSGAIISHIDSYGSGTGSSTLLSSSGKLISGFDYGDPSENHDEGLACTCT